MTHATYPCITIHLSKCCIVFLIFPANFFKISSGVGLVKFFFAIAQKVREILYTGSFTEIATVKVCALFSSTE